MYEPRKVVEAAEFADRINAEALAGFAQAEPQDERFLLQVAEAAAKLEFSLRVWRELLTGSEGSTKTR